MSDSTALRSSRFVGRKWFVTLEQVHNEKYTSSNVALSSFSSWSRRSSSQILGSNTNTHTHTHTHPPYITISSSIIIMLLGGHTGIKNANAGIQEKVDTLKDRVEAQLHATYATFIATDYRSQVVAGTIWHFKVNVGNGRALHLRVFEPLPYAEEPMEIQKIEEKQIGDSLEIMNI